LKEAAVFWRNIFKYLDKMDYANLM